MNAQLTRWRAARGDDAGFALMFVLFVTTIVTLGVGSALLVVYPNAQGARESQDTLAAQVAAQSGVDDLVAYLSSIPSCRSETRICPQALGASSDALKNTSRQRPALGNGQSFSWTTASTATSDGYVRVTSTGESNGVRRTYVADLSLQPSILAYGYYTDYESFSPTYLNNYYNPRDIYIPNSTTFGYITSTNRNGASAPQYVTWNGAAQGGTSSRCGQHWYYESAASPGRASYSDTLWDENGTMNSKASSSYRKSVARTGQCDLVFTSAMIEDGKTFSRDAFYSSGTGPTFNQAVYTMWGYNAGGQNYTSPAPTANKYRGTTITSGSPYLPAIATADLVLPKEIGTNGLSEDSCVYTGPTRVKLNGDGTATVTSPETTVKNAASDPKCYPAALDANGVLGWTIDYTTVGSGTIIARDLGTEPSSGWPANATRSTNTAGPANEVFYLPVTSGGVTQHTDSSAAADTGCTGASAPYSSAVDATCAWTNVRTANDVGTGTGWSTYTATQCGASAATNRQLFECEYGAQLSSATPALNQNGGQYGKLRAAVQTELAKAACVTSGTPATCVNTIVSNALSAANSASFPAQRNDHRYFASSVAGTPVTDTTTGAMANPVAGDALFTQPTPASETRTRTPITTTVVRQVYNGSSWTTNTPTNAFTLTTTLSDYSYTAGQGSAAYFPRLADVTEYNTGVSSTGTTAGSTGTRQPGDLYVEGANHGKLSLVADNDVIVTGDIRNPTGSTGDTDAVSIAAGSNVRNYHPVTCVDQNATDINNTSPGWCPNDITGLSSSSMIDSNGFMSVHPTQQYDNLLPTGARTIDAAIFALSGSLRTDNYDRADWVGNLNVNGGIYQSARGGNGVIYNGSNATRTGTTLQYKYVDLQRAELPYTPPATSGNYTRPWNVVSVSAGTPPARTTP